MPRMPLCLAAVAALAVASSAGAIDFGFGLLKKRPNTPTSQPPKNDPNLKLKQLLATVQSDPDIDRRKAAAEELKAADPRANGDLLPVLVGAMRKDPSPAVRLAAVEAVGGMKPTVAAGAALEAVERGDPDDAVRAAARAALAQYQGSGSRSASPSIGQTAEPPFARPPVPARMAPPPEPALRPITQGPGKGGVYKPTPEPPFAPRPAATKPVEPPTVVAPPLPAPAPIPVPMPAPRDPIPSIPLPPPTPAARPGDLPPLSIPSAPPAIVAPPPGSGLPTIVPPGGR